MTDLYFSYSLRLKLWFILWHCQYLGLQCQWKDYWLTMNGIVFGSGHGLTEVLLQHLHGGTDKYHKIIRIIASVPDYIWTKNFLNASLQCCYYTSLLGSATVHKSLVHTWFYYLMLPPHYHFNSHSLNICVQQNYTHTHTHTTGRWVNAVHYFNETFLNKSQVQSIYTKIHHCQQQHDHVSYLFTLNRSNTLLSCKLSVFAQLKLLSQPFTDITQT